MSKIDRAYPKRDVKDRAQRPFVLIDAELSSLLTSNDLHVYIHVKRRAGGNGECWESIDHMAAEVSMSRNTLKKSIRSLLAKNLISKEVRKGCTDVYTLTPPETWKFDHPQKKISEVSDGQILTGGESNFGRGGGQILTPNKISLTRSKEKDPIKTRSNTHASNADTQARDESADADVRVLDCDLVDFFSKPEPEQSTPLVQPPLSNSPFAVSELAGGEEISGACRTTESTAITGTGYLSETEKRYSPTLSRLELTELTQTLIDTYNKSKPSSWGVCTKMTAYLVKQTEVLVRIYSERLEINEAIESLKNDFGAAHLGMRGDKFYDSPTFGISSIAFFLDAKRADALQARAQVWYDRPQKTKEREAHSIVDEIINGVPCWETGQILTKSRYACNVRRYGTYIHLPADDEAWSVMPDMDHLRKYYPQIFESQEK
jgi:hypothetical protein